MLKRGILKTNKGQKNFTVTGKNKGKSKRKHHYVSTPDYFKYLRMIKNRNKKYNPKG